MEQGDIAGSIDQLIIAAADGEDVDWEQAESDAHSPDQREVIQQLAEIARLASLFRELPALVDEPSSATDRIGPSWTPGSDRAAVDRREPDLGSWGRFGLREKVGEGSFGTVYRAFDSDLDRVVALKLLRGTATDRVLHEARLLARIHHPNIVAVHGVERVGDRIGLCMEFVNGRTLKQLHETQAGCSAQEALLFGLDLGRALAAVHQAGFIHGDVKAQNVMREAGGRTVLMDFGTAALQGASENRLFRPTGTPLYLAPEVLVGGQPTVQSDLYSLGVLLFYLVSGEFPFAGRSLRELGDAHAGHRRRCLRDLRSDLPAAFIHAVDEAISPRPEQRPASAGALAALLERAAGHTAVNATPAPLGVDTGHSISVLPFVDMSQDASVDCLCRGLVEDIGEAMNQIPGLRVIARTSVVQINPTPDKAREIGVAQGVRLLLEGSVRVAGTRVRIIARLVEAANRQLLWSERFDRDLSDVFAVQDEIAAASARAAEAHTFVQPDDATRRHARSRAGDRSTACRGDARGYRSPRPAVRSDQLGRQANAPRRTSRNAPRVPSSPVPSLRLS